VILFCTFVAAIVILWFIAKDHTKELEDKHNHEQEPHLTAQDFRVARYMRHQERFGKRPRMR
jgi:hypothetical protein